MRIICSLIIIICLNSCNKNLDKHLELKINEVAFHESDNSRLEFIEIYNPHNFTTQIDSIYLIIDEEKYELKNLQTINAGQIIYKEIKTIVNNKDFNIKLNINGIVVDEFQWKSIKNKPHIGRYPDGSKLIVSMTSRSLGKTNNESRLKLFKPEFNLESGLYDEYKTLVIRPEYTNTPLYYTLDGSTPTSNSMLFKDSLVIKNNSTIKARFIIDHHKSPIKHLSLFIGENTTLPIVSIFVDNKSFWNDTIGIIQKGLAAEDQFPYKGANYWKKIQLPSYVEYFDQEKKLILSEKSKIKIHGNYSKVEPIKSLRIKANNKNGVFRFNPFETKNNYNFSELILRNSGQDALKLHFRDAFIHNYVDGFLNIDIQPAQPVLVFINGNYYGLLHLRERYNDTFLKQAYGKEKTYNLLKLWGAPIIGNDKEYIKVREEVKYVYQNQGKPKSLLQYFDMSNWIDYYIIETYTANLDWIPNNTMYWSSNETKKWHYLLNDLDASMNAKNDTMYKKDMFNWLLNDCQNKEFACFMKDADVKNKFITRYMDLLNTIFKPNNIIYSATNYQKKIEHEIPRLLKNYSLHNKLNSDTEIIDYWQTNNVEPFHDFLNKRPAFIKNQLKNQFKLSAIKNIHILSSLPYNFNSLELNDNFSGEYFSDMYYTISVDTKKNPNFSHFNINGQDVFQNPFSFKLIDTTDISIIND